MYNYPHIPVSFDLMAKPVGALCNMECSYCYYQSKLGMYRESSHMMEEKVLEEYVKQYIYAQASPLVTFNWQGGEPFLAGQGFYERALYFQKKYQGNRRIENVIQTNGTILDEQWCRFLKKNHFLVGISIDGPREIHDFNRKGPEGSSSWDKTMKGISLLKDYGIAFNTLTSISAHSVDYPIEIYNFLKSLGSKYQQYSPIVERQTGRNNSMENQLLQPGMKGGASTSPWSVPASKYGEFLCRIFDEWVRKDVGDVFVQMFESSLASWLGEDPGICLYKELCGNAMAIEKNGDVYACDHFVFPDHLRGNIMKEPLLEIVLSESQVKFGMEKSSSLPSVCRSCEFLFACNGECPKNRICKTDEGEAGLNYLCDGLKIYFTHIAPYMEFMVGEIRKGGSILKVKDAIIEKI